MGSVALDLQSTESETFALERISPADINLDPTPITPTLPGVNRGTGWEVTDNPNPAQLGPETVGTSPFVRTLKFVKCTPSFDVFIHHRPAFFFSPHRPTFVQCSSDPEVVLQKKKITKTRTATNTINTSCWRRPGIFWRHI